MKSLSPIKRPTELFAPILMWGLLFIGASFWSAQMVFETVAVGELAWWVRTVPKLVNSLGLHVVWIYYLLRSETQARFTGWYVAGIILIFVASGANTLISRFFSVEEGNMSLGLSVFLSGMTVLSYVWLAILAGLRASLRAAFKWLGQLKAGIICGMAILSIWDMVISLKLLSLPSFSILLWGALYTFLWLTHVYEWYARRAYRERVVDPEQMIDEIGKEEDP